MRYFTEKPQFYSTYFGERYLCDHPLYSECTLFSFNKKGLAVIQQHCIDKKTYWGSLDDWIPDTIYRASGFISLFDALSDISISGLYPTITVRQLMWQLRMKPLKKEYWETSFDHSIINSRELQVVI